MADICDDNRFEIIAKAKKALLEGTNIDMCADEMAVIDNILFRCWQMGWLDRYDTADTPQAEIKAGCSRCEYRWDCSDKDMPHAMYCNNYGKRQKGAKDDTRRI